MKETQILLEESNKFLIVENNKLQQELAAAKAIPPPPLSPPKGAIEDPDVVAALRVDITELRNEKEELVRRSNTIEERYKNGDLVCSPLPNLCTAVDRTNAGRSREGLCPYHQGRGACCSGTTIRHEVERAYQGNLTRWLTAWREGADQFLSQREKTIQARDMKIKQLEEMITKLHKQAAKIGDQPSNAYKQPVSDPNMLSQVSSPPVPDRDGPVKPRFHHC